MRVDHGPAGRTGDELRKGFDESDGAWAAHGPIKSPAPPPPIHSFIQSALLCSAPCLPQSTTPSDPSFSSRSHAALLAASLACLRDDGEVVVVAAADDEAAAAAARAAVHSVVAGAAGGGAEVQCGVQLRRLDHGHGQPVHQWAPLGDHLHAAALRRDLLREPHLPLLRRPRHRRLPQHQVRPPLPAPFQVHLRRLQEGRQHGHHRRHRHGRPLLPLPRPLRQDLEQRAHQLPAPVVPDHHLLRLRQQLQELPGQLALHLRGVRGQRLQRDAVRQLQHGPGEHVRAADRGHHRRRRGEAAGAGRGGRGGAGGAPHRLLPHLPHHLRHLQRRRLRLPRLPQEVQRPLHLPQQPAADQGVVPPGQVQVGAHHVRRLLRRRLRHGPEPQQIRFQLGVPGVLRVGGRQVQLRQQRAVRHVRRLRLRQPGVAPQLGRHPPHRGRLQADHRRLAQRRLLPPRHHPLATPPHGHQLRSARSLHGRIKKRIVVHGSIINQSIDYYYYYYLFSRVNYTMFSGDWLRLGSLPV